MLTRFVEVPVQVDGPDNSLVSEFTNKMGCAVCVLGLNITSRLSVEVRKDRMGQLLLGVEGPADRDVPTREPTQKTSGSTALAQT